MRALVLCLLLTGLLAVPTASATCATGDFDCLEKLARGEARDAEAGTTEAVDTFCTDMVPSCHVPADNHCPDTGRPDMNVYECSIQPVARLALDLAEVARQAALGLCRGAVSDPCP